MSNDTATRSPSAGGCYCSSTGDKTILNDIIGLAVPVEALIAKCCWSRISRIWSQNKTVIPPGTWPRICALRGEAGPPSKKAPYMPPFTMPQNEEEAP